MIEFGSLTGPPDWPRRIPDLGHLDNVLFPLLITAYRFAPGDFNLISTLRGGAMWAVSAILGGPLYRLAIGRWPSPSERALFTRALRDNRTPMPALMRGMHAVPASQPQISRLLLFGLLRDGRLPAPVSLAGEDVPLAPQIGDPLRFWEGPPISFLHFEKTAGIAIANALTEQFHPLQIDLDPDRGMPPHLRTPFPTPIIGAVRERKLVWGHYDLPSMRRLGPGRLIVTMLRDPKARLLSLYHYWRSFLPAKDGSPPYVQVHLAHTHDLLEFLRLDDPLLRDHIDNVYVRRLTGLYGTGAIADPMDADREASLERALSALDQLAFAGIVERMDLSLAGLSSTIGANLILSSARENDGETNALTRPEIFRPVPRTPITPDIDAELDRLTSLDQVIYRTCLARLERDR